MNAPRCDAAELAALASVRAVLETGGVQGIVPPPPLRGEDPAVVAAVAAVLTGQPGPLTVLALARLAAALLVLQVQRQQGGRWPDLADMIAEVDRVELTTIVLQQDPWHALVGDRQGTVVLARSGAARWGHELVPSSDHGRREGQARPDEDASRRR